MSVKERRRTSLRLLFQAVVVVLIGAGTDFADDVSREFYAVVSQVIPVLVLALFVQLHGVIDPDSANNRERARMRLLSVEVLLVAILGEVVALAAVAFHWPSSLPFVVSGWAILLILLMLAGTLVLRFSDSSIPPTT